jgi:hypothetical protein
VNYKERIDNIINKTYISSQGYEMKIIEYNDCNNVKVMFNDEFNTVTKTSTKRLNDGFVKNPSQPTVFGVGRLGDIENINRISYKCWSDMIKRCYKDYNNGRDETYRSCSVSEDWLIYSNFDKWYNENYYKLEDKTMCLDKDILIKGNKTYGKESCIFVPKDINSMFTKGGKRRGGLPIGVQKRNQHINEFRAEIATGNKADGSRSRLVLCGFNNPEEAFYAYKQAKESYIKQVADEYKSKYPTFPQKLYDAMYKYEVEITD